MTVVNFSGLCKHAAEWAYRLAALNPRIRPVAGDRISIDYELTGAEEAEWQRRQ